jgi:hypothetical protein
MIMNAYIDNLTYMDNEVETTLFNAADYRSLDIPFAGGFKRLKLLTVAERDAILAKMTAYSAAQPNDLDDRFIRHKDAITNMPKCNFFINYDNSVALALASAPIAKAGHYSTVTSLHDNLVKLVSIMPKVAGVDASAEIIHVYMKRAFGANRVSDYSPSGNAPKPAGPFWRPFFCRPSGEAQYRVFYFIAPNRYCESIYWDSSFGGASPGLTVKFVRYYLPAEAVEIPPVNGLGVSYYENGALSDPITPSMKSASDVLASHGIVFSNLIESESGFPTTLSDDYYLLGLHSNVEGLYLTMTPPVSPDADITTNDQHAYMYVSNVFFSSLITGLFAEGKITQSERDENLATLGEKDLTSRITLLPSAISIPLHFEANMLVYSDYESARADGADAPPFTEREAAEGVTWKTVFNRVRALTASFLFTLGEELIEDKSADYVQPGEEERVLLHVEKNIGEDGLDCFVAGVPSAPATWYDAYQTGECVLSANCMEASHQALWTATFGFDFGTMNVANVDGTNRATKSDDWYKYSPSLENVCPAGFIDSNLQTPNEFYSSLCTTYGLNSGRVQASRLLSGMLNTMQSAPS